MAMQRRMLGLFGAKHWLLLSALCCVTIAGPAHADKRVALVIGNSAYKNVTPLDNPKNDARLMAETLRGLGFTLVGGGAQLDLDKAGFDGAVQSFSSQVQGADVALFYYAGHGVQVRGSNYLVPVGTNPTREADVFLQMVDIALVLSQMEGSGTKLNLVILDACRNNPFGGRGLRGTVSGLGQMQAPEGTLISFATQPGNVAKDGADRNSPYTKALAQTIRRGGLDIFQTFNEVGLAVKRATGGEQQPWVSSSPIDGSFYFAGAAATASAPPAAATPTADEIFWLTIKNSSVPALFDEFLKNFPGSAHAAEARARLEELKNRQIAVVAPAMPSFPCGGATTVSLSRAAAPLSAAEECALKPKDSFKECVACPEMVVVPAGSFTMGSPASEPGRFDDEGPQHGVTFKRPFAVGKYAVTFAEWDACVADGKCSYGPQDHGWGGGRRPAIDVSWDDAKAYVAWLSRKSGKTYRLLTEAEREYVARAGTTTALWWGSSISTQQANYIGNADGNGAQDEFRRKTMPVDSFAPNPWGLYQVHGNVWEWVEDCYHADYAEAPSDGSAWRDGDCGRRVLRGGSWGSLPRALRAAVRFRDATGDRNIANGFRVARTLLAP